MTTSILRLLLTMSKKKNAPSEWQRYKKEGAIHNGLCTGAIQWWYARRVAHPNLLKLALALLHSKVGTSGVESDAQILEKFEQQKREKYHVAKKLSPNF